MPLEESGNWSEWSKYVLSEIKETREEIKNLNEQLKSLSETMIVNTVNLGEHMKRTTNVEEINQVLLKKMTDIEQAASDKLAIDEYKKSVAILVGKIFGGVGFVVGLVYSIFQILDYLKNLGK